VVSVPAARWLCAALGVLVAGCDTGVAPTSSPPAPPSERPAAAAAFDAGPVRTAAEYLAEPRFAAADTARGELLGFACAACHKLKAGEGTLIGPNLHGVFGRPAGAVAEFTYSRALQESGLVWTPVSLEAWLTDPTGFVAGTTMAFSGYRSPEDRRDLIAYLLLVTQ
jgi:cytochrome c